MVWFEIIADAILFSKGSINPRFEVGMLIMELACDSAIGIKTGLIPDIGMSNTIKKIVG